MSGSTENAISGQPPVHPQQRHHDADEHEQIAEGRDDAGREQIVDDVHIGRHARHQPTNGIAIVKGQIEPLQMRVNLHAHVVHDALADHLHHVGLRVLERERRDEHREVDERDVVETGEVSLRDVLIDGDLDEIRRRQLRHRIADRVPAAHRGRTTYAGAGRPAGAASAARRRPCRGLLLRGRHDP